MDAKTIIGTVVLIAAIAIFVCIKESISKKKGMSGEDLAKVRQVVEKLLPNAGSYTIAYAVHMTSDAIGNRITKYYYHYAVAFKPGELFVAPIKYAGGEISCPSSGGILTRDTLGQIKKKGSVYTFFDRDGKELCTFGVRESNTRQDKYEPFNIQQKAEADGFQAFMTDFMREVNG